MGLGAFCSAAVETFGGQMCKAVGFEVDERYGRPAQTLLERIPNRHPHRRLTASTAARGEVQLSCCQPALRPAPSHWGGRQGGPSRQGGTRVRRRDVAVKQFLVSRVRLLRVHRFAADSVQFRRLGQFLCRGVPKCAARRRTAGRVDFGRKPRGPGFARECPRRLFAPVGQVDASVQSLRGPSGHKYVLGDFFKAKCGVATGDNGFFIVKTEDARARGIADEFLAPIMPAPRHLPKDATRV